MQLHLQVSLVLPSWLHAVSQRKAWPSHLPAHTDYAVHHVTYITEGQAAKLELASWQPPAEGLLSNYAMLVDEARLVCAGYAAVGAPYGHQHGM